MEKLVRAVMALAVTGALVAGVANPASAHTHDLAVTGGTVTMGTGVYQTTNPLDGAGAGCDTASSINVDHEENTGDVTAFTSAFHVQSWLLTHFVVVITRTASTPGTVSFNQASGSIGSLGMAVLIRIYDASDNSSTNVDCTNPGTLYCTLRASNVHLAGTYTHDPEDESLAASDSVTLHTTSPATISTQLGAPCSGSFAGFNGTVLTVSSLTGHVTT